VPVCHGVCVCVSRCVCVCKAHTHACTHACMMYLQTSRSVDSSVGSGVVSRTMCESGTVGVALLLHMSRRVCPVGMDIGSYYFAVHFVEDSRDPPHRCDSTEEVNSLRGIFFYFRDWDPGGRNQRRVLRVVFIGSRVRWQEPFQEISQIFDGSEPSRSLYPHNRFSRGGIDVHPAYQ